MADINGNWPWKTGLQNGLLEPNEAIAKSDENQLLAHPLGEAAPRELLSPNSSSEHLRFSRDHELGARETEGFTPRYVYTRDLLKKA